ncbi:IPT/TIG domain-containing protein, partial [Streptomyces sioyaensis]|uniref:IPT/TIG domain-containing protein n=1 Tax=Streptomyces sioyaensis TaxID=67364 RepID=UPI0036E62564
NGNAYVTNSGSNDVTVINTTTNTVENTISISPSDFPFGVTVTPNGEIYVTGYSSNDVIVIPPAPTVTGIVPTSGTTLGGTAVTITGTNLAGTTGVTIGGQPATGVIATATQITAFTPPGAAGPATVTVTTPGGTASLPNGFTYVTVAPAPTVTGIVPTSGTTLGGTAVTITGTNLAGTT